MRAKTVQDPADSLLGDLLMRKVKYFEVGLLVDECAYLFHVCIVEGQARKSNVFEACKAEQVENAADRLLSYRIV